MSKPKEYYLVQSEFINQALVFETIEKIPLDNEYVHVREVMPTELDDQLRSEKQTILEMIEWEIVFDYLKSADEFDPGKHELTLEYILSRGKIIENLQRQNEAMRDGLEIATGAVHGDPHISRLDKCKEALTQADSIAKELETK